MATMTDDDIMRAVRRQMSNSNKFKNRLTDAVRSGNKHAMESLIALAVEKIWGIVVRVGGSLVRRLLDWF